MAVVMLLIHSGSFAAPLFVGVGCFTFCLWEILRARLDSYVLILRFTYAFHKHGILIQG